jgi:hypothetical protein
MKPRLLSLFFLLLISATSSFGNTPARLLALQATSEDRSESSAAIEELRAMGPSGLETLMVQYAAPIKAHIDSPSIASTEEWQRISSALDRVSQQKNSYLSGLYWYTNFEEAKTAATQSGKPILTLRLLGRLSDELSCANSRFFRTVLYSNEEISALLRNNFVLHWESVRPVPVVTIDFGDGRKLERTITGNSIHYVLDSQGRLVEALPGLYGPTAFKRSLLEAERLARSVAGKDTFNRRTILTSYYRERLNKISVDWYGDNQTIGGRRPEGITVTTNDSGEAVRIMPLAVTKAVTEANILRGMMAGSEALGKITDEEAWNKIARLRIAESRLDGRSIGLIRSQNAALGESELAALVNKFEHSVAVDTVRNEYLLRSKLYGWLIPQAEQVDLAKFNDKVYAELFLTPNSDPWLGLLSKDVYLGLDQAGRK